MFPQLEPLMKSEGESADLENEFNEALSDLEDMSKALDDSDLEPIEVEPAEEPVSMTKSEDENDDEPLPASPDATPAASAELAEVKEMMKSMIGAFDTVLMSIQKNQSAAQTAITEIAERVEAMEDMGKAGARVQIESGKLIKSIQSKLEGIGQTPVRRQASIQTLDRFAQAPEVMSKSEANHALDRLIANQALTTSQVTIVEKRINLGQDLPEWFVTAAKAVK